MSARYFLLMLLASLGLFVTGCATPPSYDYADFKRSQPRSILVLPPVNRSPDIKASYSFLSHTSRPLAEAGYYVFPVAVVNEAFVQNGMTAPEDIHEVSPAKLREIFGADTALYIEIVQYGTRYLVLSSDTTVVAQAKLVDLRTGDRIWSGSARASSNENQSNNNGLIGMLVQAVVDQVANSLSDRSHQIARITSTRLLSPGGSPRILYGPRSPMYGKDGEAAR